MVPGAAITRDYFEEPVRSLSQTPTSMRQPATYTPQHVVHPPLQRWPGSLSPCSGRMPPRAYLQSPSSRASSGNFNSINPSLTPKKDTEMGKLPFAWEPQAVAVVGSLRQGNSPAGGLLGSALLFQTQNTMTLSPTRGSSTPSGPRVVKQQSLRASQSSWLNDASVKMEIDRLKEMVETVSRRVHKQEEDHQDFSTDCQQRWQSLEDNLCQLRQNQQLWEHEAEKILLPVQQQQQQQQQQQKQKQQQQQQQQCAAETTDMRSIDTSVGSQVQTTTEASFAPSAEVTSRGSEDEELTAREGDLERRVKALHEIWESQQTSLNEVSGQIGHVQTEFEILKERVQLVSSAHNDVTHEAESVCNLGDKYADVVERISKLEQIFSEIQRSRLDPHETSQQTDRQLREVMMKVEQEIGSLAEKNNNLNGQIESINNSVAAMGTELLEHRQHTAMLEKTMTEVADQCSAAPKEVLSGTVWSLHQALELQSKDGEAIKRRLIDFEQSLRELQNVEASRDPTGEFPREATEDVVSALTEHFSTKMKDIQTHMSNSIESCKQDQLSFHEMLENQRNQHETICVMQAEAMVELTRIKEELTEQLAADASLFQRDLDDVRNTSTRLGCRLEVLEAQKISQDDDENHIRSSTDRIQEILNTLTVEIDVMKRKIAEVEESHAGALQLTCSHFGVATNAEAMDASRNIVCEQDGDSALLLQLIQHSLGTRNLPCAPRATCPASSTTPETWEKNVAVDKYRMNHLLVRAALSGSDMSVDMDRESCTHDGDPQDQNRLRGGDDQGRSRPTLRRSRYDD